MTSPRSAASLRSLSRRAALGAALVGLLTGVAACGGSSGSSSGSGGSVKLALTAYSTPAEAYAELIPAFQKTAAGSGVTFSQSYGASGAQSRAVAAGLPTDVVALSLAPDVDKLVSPGLVATNWADGEFHGMVTDSVAVLVVRKGNPKHISGWDDLVKPGVQVVTPNPSTSGAAKWNVLGGYGSQIKAGRTPAQADAWLKSLFANVVAQDKSGRDALQTFVSGKGDVLISYENEAITAQQKGLAVDYVVPDTTILIQNPIATIARSKHQAQAAAFVDFLRTAPAQEIFAKHGYRPVVESVLQQNASTFPTPRGLFTIDDLGGWSTVNDTLFGESGAVTQIEKSLGGSAG